MNIKDISDLIDYKIQKNDGYLLNDLSGCFQSILGTMIFQNQHNEIFTSYYLEKLFIIAPSHLDTKEKRIFVEKILQKNEQLDSVYLQSLINTLNIDNFVENFVKKHQLTQENCLITSPQTFIIMNAIFGLLSPDRSYHLVSKLFKDKSYYNCYINIVLDVFFDLLLPLLNEDVVKQMFNDFQKEVNKKSFEKEIFKNIKVQKLLK